MTEKIPTKIVKENENNTSLKEETITEEIKEAITKKEDELQDFEEVKETLHVEDEIVEDKKLKYISSIAAVSLVGIGAFLVYRSTKPTQNDDKTEVDG